MNQISVREQPLLKARDILIELVKEQTVPHNIISIHDLYFSAVA